MKNDFQEIKELINELIEISNKQLNNLNEEVEKIIKYHITNEQAISKLFDSILSLPFVNDEEVKSLFYKLLNYCYTFNSDLATDYEKIYKEYCCDEDIKISSNCQNIIITSTFKPENNKKHHK